MMTARPALSGGPFSCSAVHAALFIAGPAPEWHGGASWMQE